MKLLIKNSKIITPYTVLCNYELAIRNGKIKSLVPSGTLDKNNFDETINAKGNYLSPGFIDIHTHACSAHDTMDATLEAIKGMAHFHIRNGVTGFLATTMTGPIEAIEKALINVANYISAQKGKHKGLNTKDSTLAEVLGLYLEGPYFSFTKRGAQSAKYLKSPNIIELEKLIRLSKNTIKVVALAPELPSAIETIGYLSSIGLTVSAGHTDASFDIAQMAFNHGIKQVTHIFNGMKNFSHREPGIAGAALIDERVCCEMICDGIHLHPGAMNLVAKTKGKDGIILISDSMMATGLSDGAYTLGGQKVIVKNKEARLSNGALAGSTLTLNRAIYNMVHMVGTPIQDAVRMATLNPARAIGVEQNKGSIAVGKDADLVIFNEQLDILNVLKSC